MELRDFIRESLVEIAHGIHDAQFDASHIVAITPGSIDAEASKEISHIEFDIAVTTTTENIEGSEKSITGGKLKVLSFEVSADGVLKSETNSSKSSEQLNRIKFKVPIQFSAWFKKDEQFMPERRRQKDAFERRSKHTEEVRIPRFNDLTANR